MATTPVMLVLVVHSILVLLRMLLDGSAVVRVL